MDVMCNDNRFEIIDRAKKHLLEATNIDTSEDEMKVLDNFLFRCWQMGWLDRYDEQTETHEICTETHACVKAEPKYGEWIPCSERLPGDKHEACLVNVVVKDAPHKIILTNFVACDYARGWIDAWMPLPKPYKAEQTEPMIYPQVDGITPSVIEQTEPSTDCGWK